MTYYAEKLARDVRTAMGEHNDENEPVVMLVAGLAAKVEDFRAAMLTAASALELGHNPKDIAAAMRRHIAT